MIRKSVHMTYRAGRRIVVGVMGLTVVITGVVMIFTPGPGLLVILAGLGILGLEFEFARIWLRHLKDKSREAAGKLKRTPPPEESAGENRSETGR